MLPEAERRTLLEEWNATAKDFPGGQACLHELFEEQIARTPEAVAVAMGEKLSYRELAERAHRLSNELVQRGVGPDQPVGLCAERSIDMVVGVLDILGADRALRSLSPAWDRRGKTRC